MRKIIRLTESDLQKIVKRVIQEQDKTKYNFDTPVMTQTKDTFSSSGGMMTQQKQQQDIARIKSMYPCVPDSLKGFILYLMTNLPKIQKLLGLDKANVLYLAKYAMGVIGRETQFGKVTDSEDDISEWLRGNGLGALPELMISTTNLFRKNNKTQSLGLAQFTPETWKSYGLDKSIGDFNSSFNSISQGLGSLYRLATDYKLALKLGLQTGPSVNPTLKKYLGVEINGSGNNALDLAIVAHNMGNGKIKKYCTTSNELYTAPCDSATYQPFKTEESFNEYKKTSKLINSASVPQNLKKFPGVLKVNQSTPIANYMPNLKGPGHTAIGYVEAVAENAKKFNCF
jgi:hypothetical protein